ncbi:hypothetical protein [Acuticoccus sp. I52.16.1]|uniref:hypothetical protein n=1 Tax=Acuticoccus sp. I52.16.1 TaxID=2928472 RepID=UPI001FD60BA3|nr:hypothetical protein [Acuticoccus sp. I52.16.1]UOM33466.1 hypothetical protein MRB58_16630 [Acuticoccus sp. I52.16.1]
MRIAIAARPSALIAPALVTLTSIAVALIGVSPAAATSGWGCYRANAGPGDPLNVRAEPSSAAPVVATIDWDSPYIIAIDAQGLAQADLFEVHREELATCTPGDVPLGARWCPVRLYGGDQTIAGWLKRRWVDHSECP